MHTLHGLHGDYPRRNDVSVNVKSKRTYLNGARHRCGTEADVRLAARIRLPEEHTRTGRVHGRGGARRVTAANAHRMVMMVLVVAVMRWRRSRCGGGWLMVRMVLRLLVMVAVVMLLVVVTAVAVVVAVMLMMETRFGRRCGCKTVHFVCVCLCRTVHREARQKELETIRSYNALSVARTEA